MIDVGTARGMLHRRDEVAFLDLREAAPFSESHPLFATPVNFGLLEAEIGALVPRLGTPILLLDAGDGLSGIAQGLLAGLGYTDVRPIDGGYPAWAAAGLPLYSGVHVPSKTLGELAEIAFEPDVIGPDEFARRLADGTEMHFFDVRPASEHGKMRIPGTRCLPNGETAHRLGAFEDGKPIVLTCAGRTRGLIGAASLKLVAPDRRVAALEDGTQGWVLSGRKLERGAVADRFPSLDDQAIAASRARADAFADAHGIQSLDRATFEVWAQDRSRTLYLFDVRSSEEASADPLPAFRCAPVGQLVQGTDRWVGTRCARIALVCDTGLRSALAAFWLQKLGFETAAARTADWAGSISNARRPGPGLRRAPVIGPKLALERDAAGGRLVDVRPSGDWNAAHIAGSTWKTRSDLARNPPQGGLTLIGDGTFRAELAWRSLPETERRQAAVVDGGIWALASAGFRVASDDAMHASAAVDRTSFADGRHDGNPDASRLYLNWEKNLVSKLDPEERAQFGI